MSKNEAPAIVVKNISKNFRVPLDKSSGIKQLIVNFYKRRKGYREFKALEDVSFEIKKGEFFGIVGRNGSGKSTLLKLLAGTYTPDGGEIKVNGSLIPFIELGVGFNPELTGRENVFLNGALLGFSKKEMEAMYDDIVDFAELHDFMEERLKNYSSGMQVRLAFSIAIRAEGDILVLDEVLAVGDTNFQQKCFDYFGRIKNANKTVVLVTHDMSAVERFCNKALLINKGKLIAKGDPAGITKQYSDLNFEVRSEHIKTKSAKKKKETNSRVEVRGSVLVNDSPTVSVHASNEKIVLSYEINSKVNIPRAVFGTIIFDGAGTPIFATNNKVSKQKLDIYRHKPVHIKVELDNIFTNGEYTISAGLKNYDQTEVFFADSQITKFIVGGRKHNYALISPAHTLKIQ